MRLRRLLTGLLVPAFALCAAVAYADPSPADIESARQLLRQGNELRATNDLHGALARYKSAHQLVGTPVTGLLVGRTHVEVGELVEGYDALVAVSKIPPKAKETENTTAARAEADKLAREVEPRIPTVRVVPKNVPPGASLTVQIDGRNTDPGAATKVNPGKHAIVVQANGVARTSEVTIAERENKEVEVAFDPIVNQPPPATPSAPAPIVADTPTTSSRPTWIYVGFGVAGAAAIVGTVAGVMTLRGTSDLEERCPGGNCPPAEHDRLKATDRWATVSTISFAVAGAAAAVSIVGLFTTSPKKIEAGSIRPTIGLGSIGLVGAF